jgi:Tfp pilus assembly protein PilN
MSTPLVDFMPDDMRKVVRNCRARRRTSLLTALMVVLSLGVGVHSWNSAQRADAARAVGAQWVANMPGVDELVDRMTSEHSELERALLVTDGLVPPISASEVLATLTNMLPEHMSLTGLRLETEESPRQMIVMLKGYAASNADLIAFERRLAAAPAFEAVTVTESKASEAIGKRVDEFTLSFQVPLNIQIREPGTLRVASGETVR